MSRTKRTVQERFWPKVDKSGECWIWTANKLNHGYGMLRIKRDGKWVQGLAHRISFEFAKGPIPQGLIVDHICRNPSCVNPDHLRTVTFKQNQENRNGGQDGSRSKYRGVSYDRRRNHWVAVVSHLGKKFWIGSFPTEDEAGNAARDARNSLYTHNDADRRVA